MRRILILLGVIAYEGAEYVLPVNFKKKQFLEWQLYDSSVPI